MEIVLSLYLGYLPIPDLVGRAGYLRYYLLVNGDHLT